MDNQHRKIKGYRELTQIEIDLMNRIKEQGVELAKLIDEVKQHHMQQVIAAQDDRGLFDHLAETEPSRWCALAKTNLQQGLMFLTRSVAQPGFF